MFGRNLPPRAPQYLSAWIIDNVFKKCRQSTNTACHTLPCQHENMGTAPKSKWDPDTRYIQPRQSCCRWSGIHNTYDPFLQSPFPTNFRVLSTPNPRTTNNVAYTPFKIVPGANIVAKNYQHMRLAESSPRKVTLKTSRPRHTHACVYSCTSPHTFSVYVSEASAGFHG